MADIVQLPRPEEEPRKRVDPYKQLSEFHDRVMAPAAGSNSLAHLAHRVRAELEGIRRGALHAITAGELLIEAKSLAKHGQWEDWCKSAGLSPRTANHYMQLARHADEFKSANLADLTVTFALVTLAPPKPEPPEPPPPPPPPPESTTPKEPYGAPGYRAAKAQMQAEGYVFTYTESGSIINGRILETADVVELVRLPREQWDAELEKHMLIDSHFDPAPAVDVENVDHNADALTEMVDRALGVLLPPKGRR